MTVIDIRIQRITQLYDSLDPSPLHEKTLSHAVKNYIVDCAGEYGLDEPLRLVLHVPAPIREYEAEITRAIHAHFQAQHAQCRRRYRRRVRQGMRLLFTGLAVLATTLLARALLVNPGNSKVLIAISEGLLIIGWVAMWRPIEVLLFERAENHQNMALFERLSQIGVEFAPEETAVDPGDKSGETSDLRAPGLLP
ncbi:MULTISPECIES: hypothetical protein [unclassified Acidovorax]|uniref:hypothetical protein n=1 Tax=unclassified Acidovorax TaxID=2684926 RepID=UPI000B403AAE|nr:MULTISPECIES: hypothetical protein [unclassified Acidovorax]